MRAKQITDFLMMVHGIYVQPINYPTVPKGTERLRLTPSPVHTDELMDELVSALVIAWHMSGQRTAHPVRNAVPSEQITVGLNAMVLKMVGSFAS
jgi:5-aminolevulinate synthase